MMLFGVCECVCILVEEGMDVVVECYWIFGDVMVVGLVGMGFELFGD